MPLDSYCGKVCQRHQIKVLNYYFSTSEGKIADSGSGNRVDLRASH